MFSPIGQYSLVNVLPYRTVFTSECCLPDTMFFGTWHTTCEGWGGDGRTTWYTTCEGWGGDETSACTSSLVFPLQVLLDAPDKKPEMEFTGQVYGRFW